MKRILFFLLVLLLPSQLAYHFWPAWSLVNGIRVDYLSPTLYLTDILVLLFILLNVRNVRVPRAPVQGFFVLASINIIFSVSPLITVYYWFKIAEVSLLGLVVYQNKKSYLKLAVQVLPLTLLWTSLLGCMQYLNHGSLNGVFYWLGERSFTTDTPGIALSKILNIVSLRPYATLPHPNVLAGFLLISWLFLFRQRKWHTMRYVSLIFSVTVFILTESYSAWLATLVLGFLWLLKNRVKKTPRVIQVSVVTTAFLASLSLPFWAHLPLSVTSNTKERIELSYIAGLSIAHHPVVGTGLGTFISNIPHYTQQLPRAYRTRATSWLQPVHNIPLLILSELGIIGLIPLFFILCTIPFNLPLLAIFIISLFDHYWITLQAPLLLFAIIGGLTYTTGRKNSER